MASTYSASTIQDAIITAKKNETFQAFETRGSVYGALDAAKMGTPLLIPAGEIQRMKESTQQTSSIDTFKKEAEGNGTTVTCEGSGKGATARTNLSWATISEGFELSAIDMANNRYTYEEMFQFRFEEKMKNIYKRLDSAVSAALEANFSPGAGNNFPIFNDAFQVSLSNYSIETNRQAQWLGKAKSDFVKNDFDPDDLMFVGDSNMMVITEAMRNQGSNTDTKLDYQFMGTSFKFTNRITNNTGRYATAYGFKKGAIGIVNWVPKLFRDGRDNGTDVWTTFVDPRYGITFGMKVTKKCADSSSILSGFDSTADYKETFQIFTHYALPTAYSSDSYTYISKYEFDENNSVQSGSGSYS